MKNQAEEGKTVGNQVKNQGLAHHGNLYAYAANNPVTYTDPDGKAVIVYLQFGLLNDDGDYSGKYVVRSQNYFEVALFDKIQTASYPVFGETLTNLQYKISGEYKIKEESKATNNSISIGLSVISIAGDLKLSEFFEKAGSIASFLSWLGVGKELVGIHGGLNNFAIEELTCNLFQNEISSKSQQITEKLYLYAKKRLSTLEDINKLSVKSDFWGNLTDFSFSNQDDIESIRNDINNYKRELMYGGNNE
ncbi:MAG: hypothetical protein PUK76_03070 [Treponema sp.]|nr:hypothetical protein [Treponema sp.]